jgi:hypothetical protein
MLDWDIAQQLGGAKAKQFAEGHPNVNAEAAYMAGYMDSAGEREALRAIVARYEQVPEVKKLIEDIPDKPEGEVFVNAAALYPVSKLGSFL